ncbi:unnamed protein product [Trichogramma brassicae]|uniref:Uncharacterized protein n=1 Tax=Trichogramma brassicae TaxID=86971 RepID=A0A6H5HWT1_9HYME|nr:unnamed protein product [Trichogramma brassicae]
MPSERKRVSEERRGGRRTYTPRFRSHRCTTTTTQLFRAQYIIIYIEREKGRQGDLFAINLQMDHRYCSVSSSSRSSVGKIP